MTSAPEEAMVIENNVVARFKDWKPWKVDFEKRSPSKAEHWKERTITHNKQLFNFALKRRKCWTSHPRRSLVEITPKKSVSLSEINWKACTSRHTFVHRYLCSYIGMSSTENETNSLVSSIEAFYRAYLCSIRGLIANSQAVDGRRLEVLQAMLFDVQVDKII